MLGLGGSAGTTIATAAMRALPLGVPKVMLSTLASGMVRQFVGDKDIFMLNAVVDILGLNRVSRQVLSQAARAMAGLVTHPAPAPQPDDRPLVAATMFGVTTACVERAQETLERAGCEVLVFHATGNGGQAMEALIDEGLIAGVLDITTTELADEHVGGFLSAGPDRLTAAGRAGIPQVVSSGALDMVNFYAPESVPATFKDRSVLPAQRQRYADADDAGRERPHRCEHRAEAVRGEGAGRHPASRREACRPSTKRGSRSTIRPHAGRSTTPFAPGCTGSRWRSWICTSTTPDFADAAARKLLELMKRERMVVTIERTSEPASEPGSEVAGSEAPREHRQFPAGILKRFRAQIARGEPIIGGGAGTGLSAVSEEAGGIDLLIVYNSGRYRMAGRGSSAGLLAYGNANQIVKEMAYEVLPVVKKTPVLAGVNGTDPFIIPRLFLEELRTLGFAGVQNFPTVGLFDGDMRQAFEETGMSYQLEVDIIRLARSLNLLTTPYVFNPSEAERMADAGADLIVAHMGVTTGGSIGAKSSKTLDDCVARIQRIADAARGVNPDVLVICHGGPISEPPDADYIITKCRGVDGFYGASSVERLPAERAIAEQIRTFKSIRLPAVARRRSGASPGKRSKRGKAGAR